MTETSTTNTQRWQAVLSRDSRADGQFVYAVRSTGIYCRPSCPSRKPARRRVTFFHRPEAAEQAGFRACRRCRPREAGAAGPQVEAVQRVCSYIEANLDAKLTLAALGRHVHLSPFHLQRTFKRLMGITPRQYAAACRANRLKVQLKKGDNVTDALYEAGYSSSSRLYAQSASTLGTTPAIYGKGGLGLRLRYSITDGPAGFGRLLVAATEKGVCFVSLGDSDAALEAGLAGEYTQAERVRDDDGLGQWVAPVLKHLSGQQPALDLPLDLRATAFQRRVWEALRAIPYGSTRTYSEIARAIGSPQAARAVGHACATNPVSIVIPCHRAVRQDGGLGGYRWGLERKQKLLAQEQEAQR